MRKQQTSVIVVITIAVILIAFFIFNRPRSSCDTIFEQTTMHVGGNVELIKSRGELVLGREKMQELAESSQKVALHLKTCCVAQQAGALRSEQFQSCMSAAKDYDSKVQQVATIVNEADAAKMQGNSQLVTQKSAQAVQRVTEASHREDDLRKIVEVIHPVQPVKGGAEQEPNNTVLEANTAALGSAISAETNPGEDVDFFKFEYQDGKNRRDFIAVHLENQSATLQPAIQVLSEDKSIAVNWQRANAPGANLDSSFAALPGKSYYVAVGSAYHRTVGKYLLTIAAQKAYDQYEPNDEAQTATPVKLGETAEANILDGEDVDWYHLSGANDKKTTVRFENLSQTLQPRIRVHRGDKSMLLEANTNVEGADLEFAFDSELGKDYYLEVFDAYKRHGGKYKLTTH